MGTRARIPYALPNNAQNALAAYIGLTPRLTPTRMDTSEQRRTYLFASCPCFLTSWTSIDGCRQAGEKVRFLGGLGVLRGIYPSF
jgi:hypothetical protein